MQELSQETFAAEDVVLNSSQNGSQSVTVTAAMRGVLTVERNFPSIKCSCAVKCISLRKTSWLRPVSIWRPFFAWFTLLQWRRTARSVYSTNTSLEAGITKKNARTLCPSATFAELLRWKVNKFRHKPRWTLMSQWWPAGTLCTQQGNKAVKSKTE